MKAMCIIMTVALLLGSGAEKQGGKVESMIRGHIERCEADGLGIPVVEISPKLFGELVGEVGWERVLGSPGHRRWVIFETRANPGSGTSGWSSTTPEPESR